MMPDLHRSSPLKTTPEWEMQHSESCSAQTPVSHFTDVCRCCHHPGLESRSKAGIHVGERDQQQGSQLLLHPHRLHPSSSQVHFNTWDWGVGDGAMLENLKPPPKISKQQSKDIHSTKPTLGVPSKGQELCSAGQFPGRNYSGHEPLCLLYLVPTDLSRQLRQDRKLPLSFQHP